MAKADGVKVDDRRIGGEVHIQRRDVLLLGRVQVIHCHARTSLIRGFSGNDGHIPEHLPGEAAGGVHPIGLDEDLLARGGLHTDGLKIQFGHVSLTPIVLGIRGDDDRFAPSVGDAGRLIAGHLDHQLERRWFVLDAREENHLRCHHDVGIRDVGNVDEVRRSLQKHRFSSHLTIGVDADKGIVSGHLRGGTQIGCGLEMFGQNLPGLHLGIRELLILPGDLGQLISSGSLSRRDDLVLEGTDGENIAAVDVPRGDILSRAGEVVERYGRLCYHNLLMGSSL